MEPRDGVDPSELRYKGSAGAGRQGVMVRDGGLEPPPRWFRARQADPLQSRVSFGFEVSNPAGRLQRPASSPEAPDQMWSAPRESNPPEPVWKAGASAARPDAHF